MLYLEGRKQLSKMHLSLLPRRPHRPPSRHSPQDVNGPCPLIAVANVLLLRGRASLPPGVGEVGQERLVALVAEALLETADRQGLSDEERANLEVRLMPVGPPAGSSSCVSVTLGDRQ